MRHVPLLAGLSLLIASGVAASACGGSIQEDDASGAGTGTQTGAFEIYRDGCDAAACDVRPAPEHICAGGYAVTVCTKARGTCGWQVDCSQEPPPGYDPLVPVSSCGHGGDSWLEVCGALPTYDPLDCVHGFAGEPQCEGWNRAPCAWKARCLPPPCDQTGGCNTLDRSKLGATCGAGEPCPAGSTCASINVNAPHEYLPPTCIEGNNPCDALVCAAGRSCYVAESYPAQVGCSKEP